MSRRVVHETTARLSRLLAHHHNLSPPEVGWPAHCSICRKQHGAAFSQPRARFRFGSDFRWIQGEELVRYYESSPDFHRGFCSNCGSPIVNRPGPNSKNAQAHQQAAPELGVPLGILDGDPQVRPACHVFVGSRAPWFEVTDDLPQYDEYAPQSQQARFGQAAAGQRLALTTAGFYR